MSDDLEALVSRLRSGIECEESARRLDALLRPRLERYFRAGGHAPARAEELVQETLIRVFQHVGDLRAENRFLPWLFVVARNVANTELRQRLREEGRRATEVDPASVAAPPAGERGIEARGRLAWVERALRALPEQQRRCLVLAARDELSYQEIADLLGLSPLTVRNHLAEARRRLRRMQAEGVIEP